MKNYFLLLIFGIIFLLTSCNFSQLQNSQLPPDINPEKIFQPQKLDIPDQDVQGEDLKDVPRINKSVRYRYDLNTWYPDLVTIFLGYYVNYSSQKVRQFYLEEMPKYGWIFFGEQGNELQYSKDLTCEKFGPSCWPRVEIRIWNTTVENITNLEIVYYAEGYLNSTNSS